MLRFVTALVVVFVLGLAGGVLVLRTLRASKRDPSLGRSLDIAVGLWSALVTFAVLEAAFTLVIRSHGVGYTLASRGWFDRHWRMNSSEHRDIEQPLPTRRDGTPIVVFIGDSFAAGAGIAQLGDRFPDRIRTALEGRARVFNWGVAGANARRQVSEFRRFPPVGDLVVLQYFANDIEDAAVALNRPPPRHHPYHDVPHFVRIALGRSFLLNYVYWSSPKSDMGQYWGYIQAVFKEPLVLELHYQELDTFLKLAQERQTRVLAAVFPFLGKDVDSEFCMAPILGFFRSRGVTAIDLREALQDLPPKRLHVNANDYHPSVEAHERVANRLLPEIRAMLGLSQ